MLKGSIFLLSALAIFTTVSCKASDNTTTGPQFHDIIKLIPKDKIEVIEKDHLKNDDGFRAAIFYLHSKEWKDLVNSILSTPEYAAFVRMTTKYNIDIPQAINCIRNHIDSLIVTEKPTGTANLESFIRDVQAVLPLSEMAQVMSENLNKAAGRNMHSDVAGDQKIADAIRDLPQSKKMREILKDMALDVEPYVTLSYTFLGWVH